MKSADTVSRRAAERAGRRSELLASVFLLKGYRILGRRVRTRAGEIDLIVRSLSGVLCFVEVKARERADTALEAVRFRQQGRIGRAAELYLALNPHLGRKGVRFDLVTVGGRGLPRHFPAAFHPEDWRGNAA